MIYFYFIYLQILLPLLRLYLP